MHLILDGGMASTIIAYGVCISTSHTLFANACATILILEDAIVRTCLGFL